MLKIHRDRLVAWIGVVVAAMSAIALSGAVIAQQIINDHNSSQTSPTTPPPAPTCADNSSEQALPAPTAFVPTGPVTSLQATDLTVGAGPAAKAGDCLIVKYYGTLASNGQKFDEDFTGMSGFAFTLGQGRVIQGWDEGIVGMQAGGVRRLVIPSALAYGSQSPSSTIPANSDLVFVVKLLRIEKTT